MQFQCKVGEVITVLEEFLNVEKKLAVIFQNVNK